MNKKNVIIAALLIIFSFLALSACSSNNGRIKGSDGAQYSARFYRPFLDFFVVNDDLTLVSNIQELSLWHKNIMEEHSNQLNKIDGLHPEVIEQRKKDFNNFIYSIIKNHGKDFFETNQLIIMPVLRSDASESFEVRRISYYNSALTIDLRTRRRSGNHEGVSIFFGIIEITRFSTDLILNLNIE
ncbi:MAG: hypothetical protein FWE36_01645 [Erysipelotrichales bacterium]|nr:hypothetical protein [Erysipelotrichales bacterium]